MRYAALLLLFFAGYFPAWAAPNFWIVSSPDHGQTFAYGSERHRQWLLLGANHHLALSLQFTNDPYVTNTQPREYDNFIFDFPRVILGSDGRTFYYHSAKGESVPVATRHRGLFGVEEIDLLSNSALIINRPHGYLSLDIVIE